MNGTPPAQRHPNTPVGLDRVFAGIPSMVAGLAWIALLYFQRGIIFVRHTTASYFLIPLIGGLMLYGIFDLSTRLKKTWDSLDRVFLFLAAVPALLLVSVYLIAAAGFAGPSPFGLTLADWGLILLFPGTMLAASPLLRHRILPGWNRIPALIGFALPAGQAAISMKRYPVAIGFAMTLGLAWIILGFAARVSPSEKPKKNRKPSGF